MQTGGEQVSPNLRLQPNLQASSMEKSSQDGPGKAKLYCNPCSRATTPHLHEHAHARAHTHDLSWGCKPQVSHWEEEFFPGLKAKKGAASPYN